MNTSPPPHVVGLSPRAEKIIRVVSTWTVLGLAISAAILSFAGLQELALEAGLSHSIAWLLPVAIDGLVLTGSLGVISSSLAGASTWYPWTLTIIGVIASVAGNVAVALPNPSSRLVHATGPIIFALSIEGLLRIYRASAVATAEKDRVTMVKEEADIEKQIRREEREERKAARLFEASLASATPMVTPVAGATMIEKIVFNPTVRGGESVKESVKERITTLMLSNPQISGAEVGRQLSIDDSYARKIIRDIHKEQEKVTVKVLLEDATATVVKEIVVSENIEPSLLEEVPVMTKEETSPNQTESIPLKEENPFAFN